MAKSFETLTAEQWEKAQTSGLAVWTQDVAEGVFKATVTETSRKKLPCVRLESTDGSITVMSMPSPFANTKLFTPDGRGGMKCNNGHILLFSRSKEEGAQARDVQGAAHAPTIDPQAYNELSPDIQAKYEWDATANHYKLK